MQFKLDENLPVDAAQLLINAGHDALTVLDQNMGGRPDPDVAEVCQREGRALITLDLDFSDIRTYPPANYSGIIVLRPRLQDKTSVLSLIARLLSTLAVEPLDKHLWTVDETSIRIRSPQ
jgi:predicted nuclease of predicted toxin-antitoxin system